MLQSLPGPSFNALDGQRSPTEPPNTEPLLTWTSHMIASGRARPSIPEYVKVSRQLQAMFEAAVSETAPVDEIVRRAAQFISVISERPCQPA
jgi:hypothetical protein